MIARKVSGGLFVAVAVLVAAGLVSAFTGRRSAGPTDRDIGARSLPDTSTVRSQGRTPLGVASIPSRAPEQPPPSQERSISPTTMSPRPPRDYSRLVHRVGAYNVDSVAAASQAGLDLALNYAPPNPLLARSFADHGFTYVDTFIEQAIYRYVRPQRCIQSVDPCALPAQSKAALLAEVRQHLSDVDPSLVAAFYLVDDYPGNIRDLLITVRGLIDEAGLRIPTLCAFGGMLDVRQLNGKLKTGDRAFERIGVNFSPDACDAVALYPAPPAGSRDDNVDWSMARLLPARRALLSKLGWDPGREPLVGTPQTFSHPVDKHRPTPTPTDADVETSTTAFCRAGASAVIAFAWSDTYAGPKEVLENDPDMRAGLARGRRRCMAIWAARPRP